MFSRSIPSPAQSYIELGPFTIHFYALCIIAGIAVAVWLGDKRFKADDEQLSSVVADVAMFAVPAGIIGGRLYHVASSPGDFFGAGQNPLEIFAIWKGGLGIWGAISLGALGAYAGYQRVRRARVGIELPPFSILLDALAPGILLAQAIGRFGNWFNVELFGRPLDTWWALEVPVSYRPADVRSFETFHPTFAYEALWCTIIAISLLLISPRLKPGQTFALYIFFYCVGRFFIESIRIDSANLYLGLRQNEWVSVFVGVISLLIFTRIQKKKRELR
ncbi:MAG: prolipoprotein diacylglyceryl transferase [Candidatus Planktophila sp.]